MDCSPYTWREHKHCLYIALIKENFKGNGSQNPSHNIDRSKCEISFLKKSKSMEISLTLWKGNQQNGIYLNKRNK